MEVLALLGAVLLLSLLAVMLIFVWSVITGPTAPVIPIPAPVKRVLQRVVFERLGTRPCYCPESRWQQWRKGVEAGPDMVVGTGDDVTIVRTYSGERGC